MQIYQKHPNTITKEWHEEEIQNYTNDHHYDYDYNHGSILVNGTNLPSILAEHLDAVTSIENFDPMSKPNITVIDLKTQMKKTKEKEHLVLME